MRISTNIKNGLLITLLMIYAITVKAQGKRAETQNNVTLHLENVVGDQPLILGEGRFVNDAKETFTVTTFNYFISNISLTAKNGQVYTVTQDDSYFLQKASDPASADMKFNVPDGVYRSISFVIGVDSVRSTMDINRRTGALDISGGMLEGMYWTWNSGYIFMKMEGVCEQAPVDRTGQKKFRYHIGGFGGYDKPSINNIRQVTLDLNEKGGLKIAGRSSGKIVVQADAAKVLGGKTTMSLAKNAQVMFGDLSNSIADNYAGMFKLAAVSN